MASFCFHCLRCEGCDGGELVAGPQGDYGQVKWPISNLGNLNRLLRLAQPLNYLYVGRASRVKLQLISASVTVQMEPMSHSRSVTFAEGW
jgi:hypothetical protein